MTNEDKKLLLKDLSARLSHGVKFALSNNNIYTMKGIDLIVTDEGDWEYAVTAKGIEPIEIKYIKPYLRPMSSMTNEEGRELERLFSKIDVPCWVDTEYGSVNFVGDNDFMDTKIAEVYTDWLNKKMFDYRGLIPMGLALEAKEGMYETD